MPNDSLFRKTPFNGYNRDDVTEYIIEQDEKIADLKHALDRKRNECEELKKQAEDAKAAENKDRLQQEIDNRDGIITVLDDMSQNEIKSRDEKIKELEGLGVEIIKTESDNGRVNLKELMKILGEEKDIDSVYVEGGASLHASLLKEKLVNKALVYIAPKIFGSFEAKSPIGGGGIEEPDDAINLVEGSITRIDEDLFLEYYLKY